QYRLGKEAESISFAPRLGHHRFDAAGRQEYADMPHIMMGGRNERFLYPRISSAATVRLGNWSGVSTSPRDAVRTRVYCSAIGSSYTSIRSAATATTQASGIPARHR